MTKTTGLLDRRLLFVVGKGGVGKTTVATALALVAARQKKRVLLVGLDLDDRARTIAGVRQAAGRDPVEVFPGVFRQNVEGKAALEEYLHLIIPVRRVLRAVFDSSVYTYFVAAAPGVKELMAIGKIWYEVDRGRWDLVIVDSPATGHALQILRMPRVAYETFTTGLVHREAKRVWDLLSDRQTTAVSVVAVAEELPVNETITMCRQIREDLRLPEGLLFVNRFRASDLSPSEVERAASSWKRGLGRESDELCEAVVGAAREEVGWGALHEQYRKKLVDETGWRTVSLPFLFREEFGFGDVERLAEIVAGEITPRAATRRGPA